jgi:hypothetical protein
MKTSMHKLALALVAALALPTMAFATVGSVALSFSPLNSNVTSPGSSVTLTLQMSVTGFSGADAVAGYDGFLTSLNSSSGAFFIQTRTTPANSTSSPFSDPQTPDSSIVTRPGSNLDPSNNNDIGASVNPFPSGAVGNGTYTLSTWVIGVDSGVANGTYNFTTSTNIWTDQIGGEHSDLGAGTFSLVVGVPEPGTWSLMALGGIASFGLNFLRARRRMS